MAINSPLNIAAQPGKTRLRKSLKLWQVVMMGLAYLTPMTVFDTFGIVSGISDGHVPASYLLALAGVLFTAISYGKHGMIHFRLNNFKDKIRTRMLFEVFSVMSLVSMVMMAVHPQSMDYQLALLIVSTSPMVGHYFALTHTFWTNISFYVILIVSLALTAFNIWFPF